MKQDSLFADAAPEVGNAALAIPGSAPSLSPAQRQFNKLVDTIAALRTRLQSWQEYAPRYLARVQGELRPLEMRLRENRIAMCLLLEAATNAKGYTKRQREKIAALLEDLVTDLLASTLDGEEEPELAALADRIGFAADNEDDDPQIQLEALEALGEQMFGVKLDPHEAHSEEELAALFAEKMDAQWEQLATEQRERKARRKSSKKTRQREAQTEQAAAEASSALREVYRKLVRELHPDRIADDAERVYKTQLMQEANHAYEARNLLALLELQLRIEQIDPAHTANLAEHTLRHYNHILKEQAANLREEIATLAIPYFAPVGRPVPADPQPHHADALFIGVATELRALLQHLESDLVRYRNPAELKRDLGQYRPGGDFDDVFEETMLAELLAPRPRRRQRPR